MNIFRTKALGVFVSWIVWLLLPFFKGIRWIFLLILIVFVFYGVRSDFLEVLPKEDLKLVSGRFLMPRDMGVNKRSQYATRVLGLDGFLYKCDCSFGGILSINCFSDNYSLNDKYIAELNNRQVSLLLSRGPLGGADLCYELSSVEKTWFGYEETSKRYLAAKEGWYSMLSWMLLWIGVICIVVRAVFFRKNIDG